MATRVARNTVILCKIEGTYGTDPTPTGGANAMLVSNLTINPINAQNVNRNLIRSYLGGSEHLLGARYVEMSFDVELTGAGTVAVAPPWAVLMRGIGFAETLTAVTRADYTPISSAFESVTIYWYDDGVLHEANGCRGTATIKLNVGERPMASFKFTGIYVTPIASANPSATLTSWKTPQVVTDANTGDLTVGATHNTTATPALTAGTTYPSQGIEIDVGNSIAFTALLGGETVDLTAREVTGRITLDLTAAQEVTFMGYVEANTLQSVGMLHGTTANYKTGIWLPSVQFINPSKVDVNGKRMVGFDLRILPSAGNDELRVITSF